MKGILFGAAVGYVLGARAGRQRYDQIVRAYRVIADHPAVQGAAGIVRAKVSEKTGFGRSSARTDSTNGHRTDPFRRDPVIPRAN
ncbi:hypothetical protein ABZ816_28015 [Actinosynnema sp. NPDC047251]|uniref:Uncharacterized protein n=1 Tax=Saccharothrix espanaensis (strain ATCC 51144 / DSM 44229 / JCM 9112 / NBRC 15066 / NRRL 15764) TaxID=1179773 RepID=K0JTH5_SACES|nr:hypothetical protein [Saccharothrix espanaensis]CCH28852.1 hypothetical protein BN6_15280 [Saccharothrix espanaensis DSM 44229]